MTILVSKQMPMHTKIVQDIPELIEIIRELQEIATSLEKENLKLWERLITLEDIQTSEKLCSFYTGFLIMGLSKPCLIILKMQLLLKEIAKERKQPTRVIFLTHFK